MPPPSGGGYGGAAQPAMANPLVGYWKKVVLENYANFEGRARRAEYWWFTLATILLFVALFIVSVIIKPLIFLVIIGWIGLIVPAIAVAVRRLHDQDKSGWFYLLGFVPFVGGIILLVFMCIDSTRGTNQYGTSEKYPV
jgi:uncharacterized membrane protein YhaH (DUF805 family)